MRGEEEKENGHGRKEGREDRKEGGSWHFRTKNEGGSLKILYKG